MGSKRWKTATPDLSASEGVDLILDAAASYLDGSADSQFHRGIRLGLEMALGSLLSDQERPAHAVLEEVCPPAPPEPVPEWEGYRVGDRVYVRLDTPGPGRLPGCVPDPRWSRDVEGTIKGVPQPGKVEMFDIEFEVTEDNLGEWDALIPDEPPGIGDRIRLDEIEPEAIVTLARHLARMDQRTRTLWHQNAKP